MPRFKVRRTFTDAEGTHEVGSIIERASETEDQQHDLDAMTRYGMLEALPDEKPASLTVDEAVRKSKTLGRRKSQGR